jgi:D-arginine dehydrogenase
VTHYDVAIIGAGMAGASLAAELGSGVSVALIEAESQPGYHATGRSAAFWSETYGGPFVQPLTSASGPWLAAPPPDFHDAGFLSPRGEINLGRDHDASVLDDFVAEFGGGAVVLERMDRTAIDAKCDFLKPEWDRAIAVPSCADIDVAALHQAYLRQARRAGTALLCKSVLTGARFADGRWLLEASGNRMTAGLLVNAAGAWADTVATIAGVQPLGITPYRRTMLQVTLDRDVPKDLPLLLDIRGSFYFKSDGGGGLWLSPHDETPSPAVDAAPEELDVALAVDRLENASTAKIRAVTRKWAGLRSFAPDRLPVYGHDPRMPGFFWFAGQGGFGIQTAPAAAKLAASLILGSAPDAMIAGIDPERYAPGRFT